MRAFGLELSPNIRSIRGKRRYLLDTEKAAIIAARQAGVSRKTLASNFDCSLACISRTVKRFQERGTVVVNRQSLEFSSELFQPAKRNKKGTSLFPNVEQEGIGAKLNNTKSQEEQSKRGGWRCLSSELARQLHLAVLPIERTNPYYAPAMPVCSEGAEDDLPQPSPREVQER
ncbi:uncharacterized protein THITE_2109121 [Thermothielavioides terrestris NRRL 8126]|jgi:hypothetical protein|uniref:Uncharacterized protein n=1 Tax=Thermothielavioides terrestris (strain ATCC 38088 / NRRL 8126) TaxID=578455 RepID=G2QTJ6_THETT|nr:uncharacterized protein THITE_2109121 [Thermothielavioides terrestris NRRL 8126]AEO63613.1 hypothetical protein THITE_2109121 [Thermothielavioides terrestris NRRL 8126]